MSVTYSRPRREIEYIPVLNRALGTNLARRRFIRRYPPSLLEMSIVLWKSKMIHTIFKFCFILWCLPQLNLHWKRALQCNLAMWAIGSCRDWRYSRLRKQQNISWRNIHGWSCKQNECLQKKSKLLIVWNTAESHCHRSRIHLVVPMRPEIHTPFTKKIVSQWSLLERSRHKCLRTHAAML